MVWLPDGEKISKMFIRFDVIHERDGQTDGQTLHDSKDRAYASHRAVKIIHIQLSLFLHFCVLYLPLNILGRLFVPL